MYSIDVPKQASLVNNEFDWLLQGMESKNGQPQGHYQRHFSGCHECVLRYGVWFEVRGGWPWVYQACWSRQWNIPHVHQWICGRRFSMSEFLPFKSIQTLKEICHDRDKILGRIYWEHAEAYRVQNARNLTGALLKARKEAEENASNQGIVTDQHIIMLVTEVFIAAIVNIANTVSWALL